MKNHSSKFLELVTEAKGKIKEINAQQLHQQLRQSDKPYVIDVREESEWHSTPHIPGAVHMGRGVIERDIEKVITHLDTPIVVYCSGGFRCALVAESLQKMGYSQVASLDKGLQSWHEAGFEME